jgi:hypothetical protein
LNLLEYTAPPGDVTVLGHVSFHANPISDPTTDDEVLLQFQYGGAEPTCLAVWSDTAPPWPTTLEVVGGVRPNPLFPELPATGQLQPPVSLMGPHPDCLLMLPQAGAGEVTVRFRLTLDPLSAAGSASLNVHYAFLPPSMLY